MRCTAHYKLIYKYVILQAHNLSRFLVHYLEILWYKSLLGFFGVVSVQPNTTERLGFFFFKFILFYSRSIIFTTKHENDSFQ